MSRPAKARAIVSDDAEATAVAMRERMLATAFLLSVLAVGLALGGCNTAAGVGQDLQAAGQAVTGSAQ